MDAVRIDKDSLQQFVYDILISSGVDMSEAQVVAEVIVWNNLVGRQTQGVDRLPIYLKRLGRGLMRSPCNLEFIRESETICIVNGNSGFGQYVGHVAMSRAIDLASDHGAGLVGVRDSNHYGSGAYYVQMAAEQRQMGLAFSNSFPRVAPHGGVAAALGTNPFAFGAPTRSGRSVLVDLSTGAVAGSTIREVEKENKMLPVGVVVDEKGDHVVDPKQAAQKAILPFGGAKGYCLGLMVEIMAGIATGSGFSHGVGSIYHDFERSSDSGHLFVAIDISKMMPVNEFYDRMARLIALIKTTDRAEGVDDILIPGEHRWREYDRQLSEGINLLPKDVQSLTVLAKEFDLCTPW
jgi:LDH2 family malate/lactate/ureidoglycolate dehydrogenase